MQYFPAAAERVRIRVGQQRRLPFASHRLALSRQLRRQDPIKLAVTAMFCRQLRPPGVSEPTRHRIGLYEVETRIEDGHPATTVTAGDRHTVAHRLGSLSLVEA